jgi:hypothetical protein
MSMGTGFDFDAGSPRPETPEPSSIQGRRNTETNVQLLDDEGVISDEVSQSQHSAPRLVIHSTHRIHIIIKLEACLKHIFAKYCSPPHPQAHAPRTADGSGRTVLLTPASNAFLSPEGLDAWAQDTNGAPFSQETKDELVEFLDVTDDSGLTCVCYWFRVVEEPMN